MHIHTNIRQATFFSSVQNSPRLTCKLSLRWSKNSAPSLLCKRSIFHQFLSKNTGQGYRLLSELFSSSDENSNDSKADTENYEAKFYDWGSLDPSKLNFADFGASYGYDREEIDGIGLTDAEWEKLNEEFPEPMILEDLKDIPDFGVRGDPEPNDTRYEAVPFPELPPEDEAMMEAAFNVLYKIPPFFSHPLSEVSKPRPDNIFSENLVATNIRVEDPGGVIEGAKEYQSWLQFLGDSGVSFFLDHIYLESRPEPENRFTRSIHFHWQMELTEDLPEALRLLEAEEWWARALPAAMDNVGRMVREAKEGEEAEDEQSAMLERKKRRMKEEGLLRIAFGGPPLSLWGSTCFTVKKEGQITEAVSEWKLIDDRYDVQNLAKCHLFLSLLKERQRGSLQ